MGSENASEFEMQGRRLENRLKEDQLGPPEAEAGLVGVPAFGEVAFGDAADFGEGVAFEAFAADFCCPPVGPVCFGGDALLAAFPCCCCGFAWLGDAFGEAAAGFGVAWAGFGATAGLALGFGCFCTPLFPPGPADPPAPPGGCFCGCWGLLAGCCCFVFVPASCFLIPAWGAADCF